MEISTQIERCPYNILGLAGSRSVTLLRVANSSSQQWRQRFLPRSERGRRAASWGAGALAALRPAADRHESAKAADLAISRSVAAVPCAFALWGLRLRSCSPGRRLSELVVQAADCHVGLFE